MQSEFLCLNCGFTDTGTYCSNCASELRIKPSFLYILIARRLEKQGFFNLRTSSNFNAKVIFPVDLLENLNKNSREILVLEESVAGTRNLKFLFLIEIDLVYLEKWVAWSEKVFLKMDGMKQDPSKERITNLSFILLFVCTTIPSSGQLELIRSGHKRKRAVSLRLVAVSPWERKISLSRFLPYSEEVHAALNQIRLPLKGDNIKNIETNSSSNLIIHTFLAILEPIKIYWQGFAKITKPGILAKLIETEEISILHPEKLVKYMLGSVFLTAIFTTLLDVKPGWIDIHIADEITGVLLFSLAGMFNALIFHFPLKIFGGEGKFAHSIAASIYVSATFFPIFTLIEGVYFLLFSEASLPSGTYSMSAMYYISLLSKIHRVSYWKTFAVIFIFGILLGIISIPLLFLFFG
jgi:hypothetical protein